MKTIYKLYDLKFVSCTKKEFDNLLTSEIRDDCAYIINDEGKITIHLNSSENRLKEIVDLVNTKQDKFASVESTEDNTTQVLKCSTQLNIEANEGSSYLKLQTGNTDSRTALGNTIGDPVYITSGANSLVVSKTDGIYTDWDWTPSGNRHLATVKYVDDAIDSKLTTVYKIKGSVETIDDLPEPNKNNLGFVYNIKSEFTTTDLFIEGAGKTYSAGTNIVIVSHPHVGYPEGKPSYDVLAGVIDLSSYVTNEKLTSVLANKQDNLYLTATKPNNSIVNITSNTNTLIVNKLHISDYSSAQGPAVVLSLGDVTSGIEFESDDSISYFGSEIVNKKSLLNFITNGFSTEREHSLTITSYNGDIYLNDKDGLGCKIRRLNAGTEDNDAVNLSQLNAKQDILVSGNNIKTINGQSLLGSGNITIEGGGGTSITVDAELSKTSTNPVQNSVITTALYGRQILFADIVEMSILDQGTTVERIKELRFTDNKNDSDAPIDSVRFYNSSEKPVILHGISAGELDTDAVNISQLNKKQDTLTSTTDLAIRSVTASNVSTKLLQSGTDALQIVGSQIKLANNNNAAIKITNLADGTATSDAVNKGQLNTAVANKQDTFSTVTTTADETTLTADKPINITTNKYSMVYDDVKEAIKITFA